jgi:hypothetical protein
MEIIVVRLIIMTNQGFVEGINSVIAVESILSGYLDAKFSHSIQVEVLNGEQDQNKHKIYSGFSELLFCTNAINHSAYNYWVVDPTTQPPVNYTPPDSTININELEGCIFAIQSNSARGCYFVVPIQIGPLWFDTQQSGVTFPTPSSIPQPVLSEFGKPSCVYPTIFIGGINSYNGTQYLAPLSIYLAFSPYHPNDTSATSGVNSWCDSLFQSLYDTESIWGLPNSQQTSGVVDFNSTIALVEGMSMLAGFPSLKSFGANGLKSNGKEYFLDSAGRPAMPYILINATTPGANTADMNIEVELRLDYTEQKQ